MAYLHVVAFRLFTKHDPRPGRPFVHAPLEERFPPSLVRPAPTSKVHPGWSIQQNKTNLRLYIESLPTIYIQSRVKRNATRGPIKSDAPLQHCLDEQQQLLYLHSASVGARMRGWDLTSVDESLQNTQQLWPTSHLTVLSWNPGGGCGGAAPAPSLALGSEKPANG